MKPGNDYNTAMNKRKREAKVMNLAPISLLPRESEYSHAFQVDLNQNGETSKSGESEETESEEDDNMSVSSVQVIILNLNLGQH